MIFRINNKTGEGEIIFSPQESQIINKKNKLIISPSTSKKLLDNLMGVCAHLAEKVLEHTPAKLTYSNVVDTDDKSNKYLFKQW